MALTSPILTAYERVATTKWQSKSVSFASLLVVLAAAAAIAGLLTLGQAPMSRAGSAINQIKSDNLHDDDRLSPKNTFTVTNTNDSGAGSLRQALLDVNANPGSHTINFNIGGGGLQTISPLSPLPNVNRTVTIDATTQPGYAGKPIIELSGTNAGASVNGLNVFASDCRIRGLIINRFDGIGIALNSATNSFIEANYIGTNAAGSAALGNGSFGVAIFDGVSNVIGGEAAGSGNVVSGNGGGIHIGGTGNSANNVVEGNFIGVDVTGTIAVGNTNFGVDVFSSANNLIGGTTTEARNVISGTTNGPGVFIHNGPSTGNLVQGNYIGTDVTGTQAVPNVRSGVFIFNGASGNTIGGVIPGARSLRAVATAARNIISGNSVRTLNGNFDLPGIDIQASGNTVNGNYIGTDVNGVAPIPNGRGINIAGSNNVVRSNLISNNTQDGVGVASGSGNSILSNSIFANGGLGIVLSGGGNNNQAPPVITSVTRSGGFIAIETTATGPPSSTVNLEVFANDDCDLSGSGEGQTLIGTLSLNIRADGTSNPCAGACVTLPDTLVPGQVLTATATDASNNTSAFSACHSVNAVGGFKISGRILDQSGKPLAGVDISLNGSANTTTDANGSYSFLNVAAGGSYTVTASNGNYSFSPLNQTFTLDQDRIANFVGATTIVSIIGTVYNANNIGIGNVPVALTKNGLPAGNTQTSASGDYSFKNLVAGANYAVTPTGSFAPSSKTFTNLNVDASGDFFTQPSVSTQCGVVSFGTANNFAVGTIPASVAAGDFNGDGKLDLAIGNFSSNNVSILLGTGTGSFGQATNFAVGSSPSSIAVSDFNGDGKLDLAVANSGSGSVSVLMGTGNGSFSGPTNFPVGANPQSVVAADFNGDGKVDLAVGVSNLAILLGLGTGSFGAATNFVVTGGSPNAMAVADFNGDGKLDVATPGVVMLGTGTGSFSPAPSFVVGSGDPFSIATGDYNNDGKFDIAISNNGNDNVSVFLGTGTGSFGAASNFAIGFSPIAIAVGDFNGDQKLDLVTANTAFNNVSILLGNGLGSFSAATNFAVGGAPTSVVVGDFNDDGRSDLATASFQASVILNTSNVCNTQSSLTINGQVKNAANQPLPNVTLTLSGPITRVIQSDANGNYSFPNLAPGGNYAVTVQSAYFVFAPSRGDFFNLSTDQTLNFTAAPVVVPQPSPPLSDDFAGATRDATKWNLGTQSLPPQTIDPQVTTTQVNGQLAIKPLTQAAGMHYDGYVSVNAFDLRGGAASVELAKAASGGVDSIFAVGSDTDNFFRFLVHTPGAPTSLVPVKGADGIVRPLDSSMPQLVFQVNIAGKLESLPIPYDPVQHRFMRFLIDAAANSVKFQTSPDDVVYTTQLERVLSISVSALTCELTAGTSSPVNPDVTLFDNLKIITSTFQFSATGYSVNESDGLAQITVTRSGLATGAATVEFATMDGTAPQRNKYIATAGRLTFGAGELSKTFSVLIEDNGLAEGNETVILLLSNPVGSGLNNPGRSVLTIVDNDTANGPNPVDTAGVFVRQQYIDFLNRQPDAAGLAFWTNEITSCSSDSSCVDEKRVNTSGAFFLSIEFQQTGYLVERIYKVAYGDGIGTSTLNGSHTLAAPVVRFTEFLPDTQEIGEGVVVGQGDWETVLENNKQAFTAEFVQRSRFTSAFTTTLTPAEFVDKLYHNAGVTPTQSDRQAAINEFGSATNTTDTAARGKALRRVAENGTLSTNEFNRAFVLMQFFGYLRRNPNESPDADYTGYDFWLSKLNQFNGDFTNAEMVKAFISSDEYRGRFGP